MVSRETTSVVAVAVGDYAERGNRGDAAHVSRETVKPGHMHELAAADAER